MFSTPEECTQLVNETNQSPEWFMSASSKIKVIAKNMTKVALVAEEASKYLAKAYNLTKDEVTFGLPLSDVAWQLLPPSPAHRFRKCPQPLPKNYLMQLR